MKFFPLKYCEIRTWLGSLSFERAHQPWDVQNSRTHSLKQYIFLLFVMTLSSRSFAAPAMIFLLSGQSNMTGVGLNSQLTSWTNPGNVTWMAACDGGALIGPTASPLNGCISGRFGPEIGIGEKLGSAFPSRKIVLIKLSWSAASLQPLQHYAFPWFLSDLVYTNWFLPKLTEAFWNLSDKSIYPDGYVISGIFWMQGESDALEPETSHYGNYSTALKSFVESKLRTDLAKRSGQGSYVQAPFVYSQISSNWPFYSAIHREQRLAQNMISKSSCITAGKYAKRYLYLGEVPGCGQCEPNHYNWEGQLELGRAFGQAMIKILNGSAPGRCNGFLPF